MRHLVSRKHKLVLKIVPKEMLETLKEMKAAYDEKNKESEILSDQGNLECPVSTFKKTESSNL